MRESRRRIQNLDLQRDALEKVGCHTIYEEHASGKSVNRPELEHCLKALRPGDTLVVWRLERLGRNLSDLIRIVNELERQGVAFQSISESLETGSAAGNLIFHIFGSLGEFERDLIRERTHAGLAAARARGRRPKLDDKQIRAIKAMLRDPDITITDVAARYGVSRTTVYNAIGPVRPEREPATSTGG